MKTMGRVFLLWHSYDVGDGETEDKLLGVYSSREAAERRIVLARRLPGFIDHPNDFEISEYELDRDAWTEGFQR
jgi:hypothetical protein